MSKVVEELYEIAEENYKKFNENLVKGNSPIIGVRIPILRKIANTIVKEKQVEDFFKEYEGNYFEEKLIKGVIISTKEDYFEQYNDEYILELDSWCLVDTYANCLKFIGKKPDKYWNYVNDLLDNDYEFCVRLGYVLMLNYYLCDDYIDKVLDLCLKQYDEYYINMAIAWTLSEVFINYPKQVMDILKSKKLNEFVHEKTIEKINDSYRVSNYDKRKLRELK